MRLHHLIEIASALNGRGVRYLVVGGIAVTNHGYGRATFDLDLVLDFSPENILNAQVD